ncbi:hypothetical protein SETIT_9G163000v2 [Setaria italica]|uniref:Glycosyltransferase n=1 Tax=Setaria italica TaxID=4555 RepID=A0A368SH80_SETIT|nr:hypothetical protein SETIT_9G163000v2 [Setaria italica]
MAAGSSSPPPLRIVIFPWLAFGHLLPYLELAELLASRDHRVSFISTPGNIARLPPLRPAAAPRVESSTSSCRHSTASPHTSPSSWAPLAPTSDRGPTVSSSIASSTGPPPPLAVEHKVPSAMLLPSAAYLATSQNLHESKRSPQHLSNHGGDMSIAQRFFLTLERCTFAVIRSCIEWEPEFLPQVASLLRKPVLPLGLLPPSPDDGGRVNGEDAAVRWLDAQPPSSVVYVALGSEVPLRVEQVHELALGLELAGTRFLWALRKPSGVSDDDAGILPPGFYERTQGQGFVSMGWVPQVSLLAHGAVGGFLTHCGQRSLTEGFLFWRPLIMLPIRGDQGPNARLMEGKKVGLQVKRDENDGSFDCHGIVSAVRAVMLEEETRGVLVANALKAQGIIADKELQYRYIDQLTQHSSTTVAPP